MSISTKDVKTSTEIISKKGIVFHNLLAEDGLTLHIKSHEEYGENDPEYFDITVVINFLPAISHTITVNKAGSTRQDFGVETQSYMGQVVSFSLEYFNNSNTYSLCDIYFSEFFVDENEQVVSCKEFANAGISPAEDLSNIYAVRGVAEYTKRTQIATLDKIMNKLADVYYPVGHYLITSSNTNPNDLGVKGTWTLKSKTLKSNIGSLVGSSFFTANTTNFNLNGFRMGTDGSIIYCTLYGYNKVALSETNVAIGNLNFDVLGTSVGCYAAYVAGYVNSKNAAVLVTVGDSSANTRSPAITITDIIPRANGGTVAAQSSSSYGNIFIYFPLQLVNNEGRSFKDELCSEFHWLRTA